LDYLHGNLTTKASDSTARITVPNGGGVELENPNNTFDIARGTAMYDLDVQGRILLHGFTKTGPGILRLAGQGNSGLSVTLSAGAIAAASNTALDTGTFTMAGGTFVADGGDRTLGNAVNVTGNATIGSSLDGTPRALTFTGPTSLAPAATLTVSNNAATTFAGVVSGTGGIVKNGPATLTLSSTANSFTGGLTLNGGTLAVAADGSLGAPDNLVTLNAGRLQFAGNATSSRAFIMSDGVTLAPAAGGTLTYAGGASVNGGFLAAGGTHAFTDGSSLNGTTTALDSSLTTTGAVSFTNVTLRGAATQNAGTLSATDTLITSAGSLDVNGTMTAAALENDGVLRVNTGGTLNNTSGKLVSGGGALLAVATGGTLNLQNNTSLELRGSLLTNNGTVTGTTNVHFNSLASGAGTYGPVNLFENGRFAPGASAAPIFQPAAVAAATAAFAPNTTLAIEIGGAIPGTTFDQVKVAGNATLNGTLAITTTNNFEPAPLQQFQVVTFATRTGHFTGYTGQEIPHGLAYAPVYSATDLKLIATLPGDATLDGAVDFNDLVKLAQNYNTTLTTDNWWSSGDFTVDGRVDFNDLVKLAQNYNTDLLPAAPIPDSLATDWALAQAATVPEPTVGFVLMVLTLSWRRRSQS
jgi:fibronectin-binding autotransporter adhesin